MDIERLRALEKKWREMANDRANAEWVTLVNCANELRDLIAELGQEVGAEQADSCCTEDDGCPTEMAVLKRFWRQHSSPAHTSEARDAGLLDALRKIYEWEPYDAMSYGARRLAAQALNDYDAAMRQEAE